MISDRVQYYPDCLFGLAVQIMMIYFLVLSLMTSFYSVHCLSAVNYFRYKQNTVILWLATMTAKPFENSTNCMWHCNGLATYLLCMLIENTPVLGPTWIIAFCVFKQQMKKQMYAGITNALALVMSSTLTMTMDYLKPVANFKELLGKSWIVGTIYHLIYFCFGMVGLFFTKRNDWSNKDR